jgi:hypothetical protein
MLYDGKQLRNVSVTLAKLATDVTTQLATYLTKTGGQLTGALDANSQRITNLPAPQADTDPARLMDLYLIPWKDKCRAATTGNITLTGPQTIDGISLIAGDRCLVRLQTLPATNGAYLVNAGAWTRTLDMDSASELRGAVVSIEEGTLNGDRRFAQTADAITLGTTAITFVDIGSGGPAYPTILNKGMAANTTTADFQAACATTIAATPAGDGYVSVMVNGLEQVLGDGVKTKDCYFSVDAGATARAIAAITAGDTLYWVGTIAGFQLASATDLIAFEYSV